MAKRKQRKSASKGAADKRKRVPQKQVRTRGTKAPIRDFPVVGIGASAGGLDAFKRFFAGMPTDTGMAFVLIQHLDPTHESFTVELLAKQTNIPITAVQDDMRVEPDHIFVIPPNTYLSISGEKLHLTEPIKQRGVRVPIDFFFRSLAEDQHERAICIILSGTGTDGTLGLREVKAAGGMVMVQDPETSQFDGMPRSAIATGVVDHVVTVEKMPGLLSRYAQHWYVNGAVAPPPPAKMATDPLQTIIALLRARVKYDFSCYKKGTLTRRIQRRMGLRHSESMSDYAQYLRDNKEEVLALFKDLLIGVTNFFREPEAWHILEKQAIAPLVRAHDPDVPFRVWVPGCATGEEPYSIAMVLIEQMQAAEKNCDIQIFASDIDQEALTFARAGVYPENIAADVPTRRLKQFFTKGEHTYRVNKEVRESVIVAEQNLISDPPFSKLDLVSCRNLLIYLDSEVQKRIFALFHFALNNSGFLFLGNSETINGQDDLFQTVSKKWRIYHRIGAARRENLAFPPARSESGRVARETPKPAGQPARLSAIAQQFMLQRFCPAAVLINRRTEVLYLFGPTDLYLQLPAGELDAELPALARDGLRTKLRAGVHQAIRDDHTVIVADGRVKRGASYFPVRITIEPLRSPREADGLLLVAFEEDGGENEFSATAHSDRVALSETRENKECIAGGPSGSEVVIRQLEDELRHTRDDLQSMIEELETSNEEFKAANEEVTSINEELQSTNEELETSKEELQSLNEELSTVNNQLEQKVGELEETNNDLINLLSSTDIATVFLDRRNCIKRFTPATTRLLSLIATDIGRPISDITQRFSDDDLLPDAEQVLERLAPIAREVRTDEGNWYIRRIMPYRTEDNRIDGTVVTFTDITERKQAEEELQQLNDGLEQRVAERAQSHARLASLVASSADAVIALNLAGEITDWNGGAEQLFGYTEKEAVGRHIEFMHPRGEPHRIQDSIERLRRREMVAGLETVRLCKNGHAKDVSLTVSLIKAPDGRIIGISSVFRDITDRKRLEQRLAEWADQERQRIGRELHDNLSQQISAIGLLATGLKNTLVAQSWPDLECVSQLVQGIEDAKAQVRALSRGLLPVEVDAEGLMHALRDLTARSEEMFGMACIFDCPRPIHVVDNMTATQLYYIAQESINNAGQHARADQVSVSLDDEDGITLRISDDGVGLPSAATTAEGNGLRIMRYRAGLIGAWLSLAAGESGGTVVTCTVPKRSRHGKT